MLDPAQYELCQLLTDLLQEDMDRGKPRTQDPGFDVIKTDNTDVLRHAHSAITQGAIDPLAVASDPATMALTASPCESIAFAAT